MFMEMLLNRKILKNFLALGLVFFINTAVFAGKDEVVDETRDDTADVIEEGKEYGVSFATGYASPCILPLRFGLQKYWEKSWREDKLWAVRGYWEGSFYHLAGRKKGPQPNSNKSLQAVAAALVFRIERNDYIGENFWPFVDLGIGASYLTKKEIGGRKLGIHFQFEDRIGFGFRFGEDRKYELGYRWVHFSNAYLGKDNNSLNLHMLVFSYWF